MRHHSYSLPKKMMFAKFAHGRTKNVTSKVPFRINARELKIVFEKHFSLNDNMKTTSHVVLNPIIIFVNIHFNLNFLSSLALTQSFRRISYFLSRHYLIVLIIFFQTFNQLLNFVIVKRDWREVT